MAKILLPLIVLVSAMLLLEIFSPYQHSGKSFGKGCNPPNRLISTVGASPTKHEKSLTSRAQQSIWVKCPYQKHMGITPSLTGDKNHNVVTNNKKYLSGLTPVSTTRMIPIQKNTMSSQVVSSIKKLLNNTSPWVYAPEITIRKHRTNQPSFINLVKQVHKETGDSPHSNNTQPSNFNNSPWVYAPETTTRNPRNTEPGSTGTTYYTPRQSSLNSLTTAGRGQRKNSPQRKKNQIH